jgi:predicted dienelactone hydrolase
MSKLTRGGFVLTGAAFAASPAFAQTGTGIAQYAQPGPFTVTDRDETWHDPARSRDIPVRFHLPSAAPGALRGTILFSHGLGGSNDAGAAWTHQWASQGFLSINVQHIGSDSSLYIGKLGQGKSLAELILSGISAQSAIARFADITFVIDELQRRQRRGSAELRGLDLAHIGMSGHSFGAETTLGAAGEAFPRNGVYNAAARETRISAAIAFSPSAPGEPAAWPQRFGTITIPTLLFTGTLDGDVVNNGTTPENRRQPFANMAAGNKFLAVLDTADHYFFGNPTGRGLGAADPKANTNRAANEVAVRAISTAFWDAYLAKDANAMRALRDIAAVNTLVAPGTFAAR